MATYISRTPAGAGDRRKWTFSCWFKLTDTSTGSRTLFASPSDGSNYNQIWFSGNDFRFDQQTSGSPVASLVTDRKFRDPGAWMHIVCVWDSDNATPGDRMKLYVNGVEETSFSTDTNPAQYLDSYVNSTSYPMEIGAMNAGEYFNGNMSHVQFVNAAALAPTEFGEVDSTSGIWKIKTSAYATPGTNGFFLKMEDRTNLDLDSSSNAYTFTTTGTLTPTYDNPSNNFATLNPLDSQSSNGSGITYAYGNTQVTDGDSNWRSSWGTLGESVGKYYYEAKVIGASGNWWAGICDSTQVVKGETKFVATTRGYGTNSSGDRGNSGSEASWSGQIATAQTEVVMIAVDLDNGKIYFGSEGVWMDSGDPTSGATGTGAAYSITTGANILYLPAWSGYGTTSSMAYNFGNGYFATTAITSEGTNASGIGSFEFDVPTGYTAWSTKGFNV